MEIPVRGIHKKRYGLDVAGARPDRSTCGVRVVGAGVGRRRIGRGIRRIDIEGNFRLDNGIAYDGAKHCTGVALSGFILGPDTGGWGIGVSSRRCHGIAPGCQGGVVLF